MKKMILLAGPCAMESKDVCFEVASVMKNLSEKYDLNYYFKTSFDKANRTSIGSYRGMGIEKGLEVLDDVKSEFGLKIVTDIHEPWQAAPAGAVADIIQIPAFLCRQTDLLIAAAKTGKIVNVKKAQFMAPWDMKSVIEKLEGSGAKEIMLCERGTSFGYNNFIVDITSIPQMAEFGYPVIFDATHSVQKPSSHGNSSGGNREMVPFLAKAALAAGADGLFMEIHPNPDEALCDGPNMIALKDMDAFLDNVKKIYQIIREGC